MSQLSEFVARILKSGLAPLPPLKQASHGLKLADNEASALVFAEKLVELDILTEYQASRLLSGRSEGFFFGKRKILRPLGKGGSSRVYLASEPDESGATRLVALKVLVPSADGDARLELAAALKRFERELEVSRRLFHPRIPQAFDIGQEGSRHYLAMEYVPGVDAETAVLRSPNKSWEPLAAVKFLVKILDVVVVLHASGVVHRDIKPSNLMIKPNGDAAILDLGSARILGDTQALLRPRPAAKAPSPSQDNVGLIGTLDYTSPEQIDNPESADIRSDLYSLGCTLYFLLTGAPPFAGGNAINKIFRHQMESPAPIPNLSPELAQILNRLLAKNPQDRFDSCGELQSALNGWRRRERLG